MISEQRLNYWKRRCRDAEQAKEFEAEHARRTTAWAHRAFDERNRLESRCSFLYEQAIRAGATPDDLIGPNVP